MNFSNLTKTVATSALVVAMSASSALSVEAMSTIDLNVRSGPGTNYAVVDSLYDGEVVDVTECNQSGTWCKIYHSGPDGWVSAKYLAAPNGGGQGNGNSQSSNSGDNDAALALGLAALIGIGAVVAGTAMQNNPPPVAPKVCFYGQPNYGGAQKCVNAGTNQSSLGWWNDRISSIKVFGGAKVRVCRHNNYNGICKTYANNKPNLPGTLNDNVSSYKTW